MLSVLVLLVFLKNWRATLVASIVIPIAVLIAVVFMRLFNMSFNLMTLGGIAACIGVVIDDAIVMVENISVHLSMGQSPGEASRNAIEELAPRDALLLRLRYERDLTQARLARIAGMPEGTVKIRLHRIRGRLRERLTGDND